MSAKVISLPKAQEKLCSWSLRVNKTKTNGKVEKNLLPYSISEPEITTIYSPNVQIGT